jgi:pimeloyl-ACP methyl ester carboxylesterase
MKKLGAFALAALAVATTALAQTPRAIDNKRPVAVQLAKDRPIVIIGGWSNCPADFDATSLVRALREARGADLVLLTNHQDPWGDIDANAAFEGRQIKQFMDNLQANRRILPGTKFDLVGFSMGGLVSRSLVLKNAGELGPWKVQNLVTMATPNHGANPILTTIDPGVGLSFKQSTCFPGRGPVSFNGSIASRQMNPSSDFLRDLNGRTIPADIKVSTIAGDMFADLVTMQNKVFPSLCNANCSPVGGPMPIADGSIITAGSLRYVDQWHGACEVFRNDRGTGVCKKDTVCAPHQDRFQDGGVWKCKDRLQTPSASVRVRLGSDGFIRVSSVQLFAREAANLGEQAVVEGVYHTQGTEDEVRGGPSPRPLVDARGVSPSSLGQPVMGTGIDGSWFFEDTRVRDALFRMVR